jgi:pimeloyl-ACP methyl ester carboxylesterase
VTAAVPVPIVLLPGLDGTAALRTAIASRLAFSRAVTVIAYDDDPALDYDALDGFVRARLPAGRFVVLGESFSGPVAIRLAYDERDRVAGLVLASTFARNPWPSWLASAVSLLDARYCPDRLADLILLGDRASPELSRVLHQVVDALPRTALQARSRAALTVDVSTLLAATTCPALCLSGSSDWLVQRRCASHIRALRPDCEMIVFDGSHNLLMTHVDEATLAINQFCDKL